MLHLAKERRSIPRCHSSWDPGKPSTAQRKPQRTRADVLGMVVPRLPEQPMPPLKKRKETGGGVLWFSKDLKKGVSAVSRGVLWPPVVSYDFPCCPTVSFSTFLAKGPWNHQTRLRNSKGALHTLLSVFPFETSELLLTTSILGQTLF